MVHKGRKSKIWEYKGAKTYSVIIYGLRLAVEFHHSYHEGCFHYLGNAGNQTG